MLDKDAFDALHLLSSQLQIDATPRSFDVLREALVEHGVDADRLDREIHTALATSSTISYVHMGRPETILINSEENVATWNERAAVDDPSPLLLDRDGAGP